MFLVSCKDRRESATFRLFWSNYWRKCTTYEHNGRIPYQHTQLPTSYTYIPLPQSPTLLPLPLNLQRSQNTPDPIRRSVAPNRVGTHKPHPHKPPATVKNLHIHKLIQPLIHQPLQQPLRHSMQYPQRQMLLLHPPRIAWKRTDAFFRIRPEFQPASQFEVPAERIFGGGEPAVAGGVEFGAQGALQG